MFDATTTIHLFITNGFSKHGLNLSATQKRFIAIYQEVKEYPMFEDSDSEGKGNFKHYPGVCPETPPTFNIFIRDYVNDNDALSHFKPGELLDIKVWAPGTTPPNISSFLNYLRNIIRDEDKKA
jgi:hypothetical protein